MSSRCTFLLQYFSDRHILLKDEWLTTVIEFLNNQKPQAKHFDDEKFANLVLDQWICSSIESSSFPVFGNHGIEETVAKQNLQGPIVCQINGFIDVGSPYYQQYCSMSGNGQKEDQSGFEKVFHEKDNDTDQKPSRLLKLTLFDGETTLKAIEFWKCPQLSLHYKPGTKILIVPPCAIRKGTFLLKRNNCKVLGGQVLPQLNSFVPVDQYARLLGIKSLNLSAKKKEEVKTTMNSNTDSIRTVTNSVIDSSLPKFIDRPDPVQPASGPSSLISRYFQKKQCPPSTSKEPETREISPDIFNDEDGDYDFENENIEYDNRQSTSMKAKNDSVLVSSLLSKMKDDTEDFDLNRRMTNRSPKKRNSIRSPPMDVTRRISGMLTSRRVDPMDEILENMIEKDEEPVSCPSTSTKNPFKSISQPPKKKIKSEPESDDDIQIIELVSPSQPVKKEKLFEEETINSELDEENTRMNSEERQAMDAFSKLNLSSLAESMKKMKYSIGSKRFILLAFIEDITEQLRVVDKMWTMKVHLKDCWTSVNALIDNRTLQNLIGFSCEEASTIRKSKDAEKRLNGKMRLNALEHQLQRLDLVFEIEFFAGTLSPCPVVRSIKTLSELIDVY